MLAVLMVATAVGLVVLWPEGELEVERPDGFGDPERAEVVDVELAPCPFGDGSEQCLTATAELTSGPDEGDTVELDFGTPRGDVTIEEGDSILVAGSTLPSSTADPDPPTAPEFVPREGPQYVFVDFDRRAPMLLLAAIFAAIVLVAGRWHGLRALVGLGAGLLVVVLFVVPALLRDGPALWIAAVGAMSVMLLTIPLSHGFGPKSVAAALGTTLALALTIALTATFTGLADITGFSEESAYLQSQVGDLSVRGLLLAGVVIGALGVLDDVTISQSSTVLALHHANPSLSSRELFTRGLVVGRDHLTATVNTLVLAYAGASLPLLLTFSVRNVDPLDAVNYEAVAAQVIATLTGSIGLIAAVPITTGIAAWLAHDLSESQLEDATAHSHAHHH